MRRAPEVIGAALEVAGPGASPSPRRPIAALRIRLLGGFRVEREDGPLFDADWRQRRSAKQLTKLMATQPNHSLHREQVLDILWGEANLSSATNSLAKALHAARCALEPGRTPRQDSAYLHLRDDVLALDSDHVSIDADLFQGVAKTALQSRTVAAYEAALAAYGGELLPEDRYEDWTEERRRSLTTLHAQVLLGLAEEHLRRHELRRAAEGFQAVLQQDPCNEDVHRRLIRLHAEMGNRSEAIRQFQVCRGILEVELGMRPSRPTEELYSEILSDRVPRRPEQLQLLPVITGAPASAGERAERAESSGLVGRGHELQVLRERLERAAEGRGGLVLLSGETGVGKTRLVGEFLEEARCQGIRILGDEIKGEWTNPLLGPLALDRYLATIPPSERQELARLAPAAARPIPSAPAGLEAPLIDVGGNEDQAYLLPAVASLLTEVGGTRPLVIVLGELRDRDGLGLDLVQYLAQLAALRPWLLVGTLDIDWVDRDAPIRRTLDAMSRDRLCVRIEMEGLGPEQCRELVASLLVEGAVDERVFDHVARQSLGFPLFVEDLVRAMKERGEIVLLEGRWQGRLLSGAAPPRVRSLVRAHLARLDADTALVLSLVAAGGEDTTLVTILGGAAVAAPTMPGGVVLDALDRALHSGLIERAQGTYAFRQPLIRSGWLEEMSTVGRAQVLGALSQLAAASGLGRPGGDRDDAAAP